MEYKINESSPSPYRPFSLADSAEESGWLEYKFHSPMRMI